MIHDPARAADVRREITEYFAGKRKQFSVSLSASGTMFQQQVWMALRRIPFGKTRSYGDRGQGSGKS